MNTESKIDAALRLIGSAEPPSGLEQRVMVRLTAPRRRFTTVHAIAAIAIAASVAIAAMALGPLAGDLALRHNSGVAGSLAPRVTVPAKGAFGAASAVHVPSAPLPLAPAPVNLNHGRGQARSGRASLPAGSRAPRAAGVTVPGETAGRLVFGSEASTRPAAVSASPGSTNSGSADSRSAATAAHQ